MKTAFMAFFILTILSILGPATVTAGQNDTATTATIAAASPDKNISTAPVACDKANAVKPITVAASAAKCPGGVYCNNPNTNCGEFCCEWGYFYSNGCDCRCYRSSTDAGAKCSSYFRCN